MVPFAVGNAPPVRQSTILTRQVFQTLGRRKILTSQNGEIADPPVAETTAGGPPIRFAAPLSSDASVSHDSSSIFCLTCLKNQHLLTQTLASYLPPPSHPEYAAYEAAYPAYRTGLEERYPPVCDRCAPRVRERIRHAGYAAKADHLRRMNERSRHGARGGAGTAGVTNWRHLVLGAGALAFWASVTGQLAWDAIGVLSLGDTIFVDSGSEPLTLLNACVVAGSREPDGCATALAPYAGQALVLGLLSVWWNPRLRDKLSGTQGRLKGLGEYYRIQMVVLVARFVAWGFLHDATVTGLNPQMAPAIHAVVGIVTIIVSAFLFFFFFVLTISPCSYHGECSYWTPPPWSPGMTTPTLSCPHQSHTQSQTPLPGMKHHLSRDFHFRSYLLRPRRHRLPPLLRLP